MATSPTNVVECFVVDPGFVDESKMIYHVFNNTAGTVASLNPKAMSYFNTPSVFKDKRDPTSRLVNWSSISNPSLVVDEDVFSSFVTSINGSTNPVAVGLFRIIDKLLFAYDPSNNAASLETFLLGDNEVSAIYVPNSLQVSTDIVAAKTYNASGVSTNVSVPSFCRFSINVPNGQTTSTYVMTVFASSAAWLLGYDKSTIVEVIQPLTYERILNGSISGTTENIFTTAKNTANISYAEGRVVIGDIAISGMTQYNAVITDGNKNTASVPFNILYKGRTPTLQEIRAAIREELLTSGVGDQTSWEARMPGVFVAGRFYVVPLWDLTFEKPNQTLYPSILNYSVLAQKLNKILDSTGFGDLTPYADVLPVFYNKMSVVAVPDLTGVVDIKHLIDVVPDYQNYTTTDESFAYMTQQTKDFAIQLNTVLSVDQGVTPPGTYTPITENLLTFYSFVVEKYEVCVITQNCYTTIMERTQ